METLNSNDSPMFGAYYMWRCNCSYCVIEQIIVAFKNALRSRRPHCTVMLNASVAFKFRWDGWLLLRPPFMWGRRLVVGKNNNLVKVGGDFSEMKTQHIRRYFHGVRRRIQPEERPAILAMRWRLNVVVLLSRWDKNTHAFCWELISVHHLVET